MTSIFLEALFIILCLLTLLWLVSVFIKNVSIVDIFWGFGFVVVNAYYLFSSGDIYTRKLLVMVLVAVWGLRLSIYLAWRNTGKKEDFRYREFRKKYGPERYWWFSYFQVFLLQGVLMLLVALPLLGTNTHTQSNGLIWLDYVGIVLWSIGFIFEAGGDIQLARFKANPDNNGKVLNSGLWKYTRHPNYFGDALVWWAYAVFSIASDSYWTIIGSILMTLLIIKISGVDLLEKSLNQDKPHYTDYVKRTSAFIPWFPKRGSL